MSIEGKNDLVLENKISVYPNPAKSEINFALTAQGTITLKVYNALGKVVYTTQSNGTMNQKMNVSQLGSGVYIANFNVNGTMVTKKFVVE